MLEESRSSEAMFYSVVTSQVFRQISTDRRNHVYRETPETFVSFPHVNPSLPIFLNVGVERVLIRFSRKTRDWGLLAAFTG